MLKAKYLENLTANPSTPTELTQQHVNFKAFVQNASMAHFVANQQSYFNTLSTYHSILLNNPQLAQQINQISTINLNQPASFIPLPSQSPIPSNITQSPTIQNLTPSPIQSSLSPTIQSSLTPPIQSSLTPSPIQRSLSPSPVQSLSPISTNITPSSLQTIAQSSLQNNPYSILQDGIPNPNLPLQPPLYTPHPNFYTQAPSPNPVPVAPPVFVNPNSPLNVFTHTQFYPNPGHINVSDLSIHKDFPTISHQGMVASPQHGQTPSPPTSYTSLLRSPTLYPEVQIEEV